MSFNSPNIKIIVAVVFIGILGYFGYTIFFSSDTSSVDTSAIAMNSESQTAVQEILDAVDKFQRINIQPEVFSSDLFQTLKDFTVPLTPEPEGRANPFAPIGTGGSFTAPERFSVSHGTSVSTSSPPTSGKSTEI